MKSLQSDLEAIFKELGLAEELKLIRLRKDLNRLFSQPLASHIYPAKLKKGELTLIVDSTEWLHQIRLYQQQLLGRLTSYGVKTLRFRLGRVSPPKAPAAKKTPEERSALPPLPEELKKEIKDRIGDPELQKLIETTIRKSLRKGR